MVAGPTVSAAILSPTISDGHIDLLKELVKIICVVPMLYNSRTGSEAVNKNERSYEVMTPSGCSAFRLLARKLQEIVNEITRLDEKVRDELNTMMKGIMDYANNECRGMGFNEVLNIVNHLDSALGGLAVSSDDEEFRKLVSAAQSLVSRMRKVLEQEMNMALTPTAPYPGYVILSRPKRRESIRLTRSEIRVYEKLAELGKPVRLSELSKEVGMDRSNLLRILKILVLAGRVEKKYVNGSIVYVSKSAKK